MIRWNAVITLVTTPEAYQDDEGTWHEGEQVERTVFCNPMTIGSMTMAQLRSSEVRITNGTTVPETGLRQMAMVQVKTIDYEFEQQCIYKGIEMDIISAIDNGENTNLLIKQRLGND